jgi:hypothetical protein
MNVFAEMTLAWVGAGIVIATAVLIEHFRRERGFPKTARWWLVPILIIGWPWPVFLWYAAENRNPLTARIVLVILLLMAALGFGWGFGLKLYDSLYPRELEPPDAPALNATIERLISNPSEIARTRIEAPPPLLTFR